MKEDIGGWEYSGQVTNHNNMAVPDGIGRIVQKDLEIIYEGEFKMSAWHGHGRLLYNKFGSYEGKFF